MYSAQYGSGRNRTSTLTRTTPVGPSGDISDTFNSKLCGPLTCATMSVSFRLPLITGPPVGFVLTLIESGTGNVPPGGAIFAPSISSLGTGTLEGNARCTVVASPDALNCTMNSRDCGRPRYVRLVSVTTAAC